jgi:hypothetical protein
MRRLIRTAEDDLAALDAGQMSALSRSEILTALSNGIAELEMSELGDTASEDHTAKTAKAQKSKKTNSAQKSIQP